MQQADSKSTAAGRQVDQMEDFRIYVCGTNHPRLAKSWGPEGGWEAHDDGPVFVVIGRETSDEECGRLADRFGLLADGLMDYRDRGCPGFYAWE